MALSRNCSRAASRSSTISWARTPEIREVVGFFEAFVCELEDVEVAFSRLMSFQVVGAKQVTKRPLFYSPRYFGFVLSSPIIDVLIPLREVRTRKLVKKYSVHRMLGIFQPAYHVRVN
jgi:hypothetical protein